MALKGFNSSQSLMGVKVTLELHIDVPRTVINKEAATTVQCWIRSSFGGVLDSKPLELSTFSGAHKVVKKDKLARLTGR